MYTCVCMYEQGATEEKEVEAVSQFFVLVAEREKIATHTIGVYKRLDAPLSSRSLSLEILFSLLSPPRF